MLKDSLVPQQTYDEIFAKYQGAQAQYIAVQAELDEAKGPDRATNNGSWPKGKSYWRIAGSRNRRPGALYRCSQDMSIETITLNWANSH
jgi:HlyD family secretion protein